MSVIRYVHVPDDDPDYSPGDWFFHEGEWAQCGETGQNRDGTWYLNLSFEKAFKPLPEKYGPFASLAEVKKFVSDYFELPVEDRGPPDLDSD